METVYLLDYLKCCDSKSVYIFVSLYNCEDNHTDYVAIYRVGNDSQYSYLFN